MEDKVSEDQQAGELLIQVYKGILEKLTSDRYLAFRATIQNDLGSTYTKIRWGNRDINLTQAIHFYQEALQYWTAENVPHEYAFTQRNLGRAYRELQTGDLGTNLTKSVKCFQEALRIYNLADTPDKYAMTLCELGETYFNLSIGERGDKIAQAIKCYKEALNFYNARSTPRAFGSIQYYLGEIYRNQPTRNKAADFETAIEYFQEALRYLQPKTSLYIKTWNHLGETYRDIPTGDRETNLKRAIECFCEAERNTIPDTSPEECATIQSNLDACLKEASQLKFHVADISASATPENRAFMHKKNLHYHLHQLLRIPYHENLSLSFSSDFNNLYERLVLSASKVMNSSEKKHLEQITLKLSMEPRINASADKSTTAITICFGMMRFILQLLYIFFCEFDIETRRVPRFAKISRAKLDELTLTLIKDFWEANGNISEAMEDTFEVITKSVDDDVAYMPIIQDIYENIGSFIIAHELAHIILNEKKKKNEKIPAYDIVSLFLSGLKNQGLVDKFTQLTGSDPDYILQSWSEELCADAIAFDLCLSQEPVVGCFARLLTDERLKRQSEQIYNNIAFGYAVHLSIDLFFILLHMLDLFYVRLNQSWVPMESHPPSLVRLVFARSIFIPPQVMVRIVKSF